MSEKQSPFMSIIEAKCWETAGKEVGPLLTMLAHG